MSLKFAVVGKNLSSNINADFFNWMYKQLDWDKEITYESVEINENGLEDVLNSYDGVNITMPYKKIVEKYLKQKETGFPNVNCVKKVIEGLYGNNTDWVGFLMTLYNYNINFESLKFILFGDGCASKTIQRCLGNTAVVINRDRELLQKSIHDSKGQTVVINCTPLGTDDLIDKSPLIDSKISKEHILMDINYNPIQTRFLINGKENGNRIINGTDMFIYQALGSIGVWQTPRPLKYLVKNIELDKMKLFIKELTYN